MATYSATAAEIKVQILESCNLYTLYQLIEASATANTLYHQHAASIITAVVDGRDTEIANLIRETFKANYSKYTMTYEVHKTPNTVLTRMYWQLSAGDNIWAFPGRFNERLTEILREFALVEHEVDELTAWILEHQSTCTAVAEAISEPSRPRMSASNVCHAMWRFRLLVSRMANLDVGTAPIRAGHNYGAWQSRRGEEWMFEQHVVPERMNVAKRAWMDSRSTRQLWDVACVLKTLESGYGRLIRHGLRPATDSMLHVLLAGRWEERSGWTKFLRLEIEALVIRRSGYRPALTFDVRDAARQLRERGAVDESSAGVPRSKDLDDFRAYLDRNDGSGAGYLDRFQRLGCQPDDAEEVAGVKMKWMRRMVSTWSREVAVEGTRSQTTPLNTVPSSHVGSAAMLRVEMTEAVPAFVSRRGLMNPKAHEFCSGARVP